jgi:hypothetical protein
MLSHLLNWHKKRRGGSERGRLWCDESEWSRNVGQRFLDHAYQNLQGKKWNYWFRINKQMFNYVLGKIADGSNPDPLSFRMDTLTGCQKLQMALLEMGTTASRGFLRGMTGYGQSTFKIITDEVCHVMRHRLYAKWIRLQTAAEIDASVQVVQGEDPAGVRIAGRQVLPHFRRGCGSCSLIPILLFKREKYRAER